MGVGTGPKGEHYSIGATKWGMEFLSAAMAAKCHGWTCVTAVDGNEVVCDSVVRQRHCVGIAAVWVSLGFAINGSDGRLIIVLEKSGGLQ